MSAVPPEAFDLTEAYRTMVMIRTFETRVGELFAANEIPGFVHLSIGQEAVAAGVVAALGVDDYVTLTHRGHGQMIAKGGQLDAMMCELMGRSTGYCKGRGGSMHLFGLRHGILGANGILGAAQPQAVGAALSARIRGTDQVTVTFLGEGASAQGAVHEAMNLAAVWKLPVVFLFEVNGFAELTPYDVHVSIPSLADRGSAYGIPGESVDGSDVAAVFLAAERAVQHARSGAGPTILEVRTVRWSGHYEGDPQRYRDEESMASRASNDPIRRLEAALLADGSADQAWFDGVAEQCRDAVEIAVASARSAPWPSPSEAYEGVYA